MRFEVKSSTILIVGPIFDTVSGPSGQGGALYTALAKNGYNVMRVSKYRGKLMRLMHILYTVLAKSRSYDMILMQSYGLLAFVMEDMVSYVAKTIRKPIAFTLHGGAFYEFYSRHPAWVRRVLNRADRINSPSQFLIKKFQQKGINIEYLPNGLDLSNFPYKRNVSNIHSLLWVRAFHEIYHPELIIEAVAILKTKYPQIKLAMVGPDQGLLDSCLQLIKKLGVNDHIDVKGYVPNRELYKYYQAYSVFVTTTRYESFGVSIVEAASCGIPCVCIPEGEIPYLWTNEKNIVFSDRDADELAKKIEGLFEDQNKIAALSFSAREHTENFSWEKILPHWEMLIADMSADIKPGNLKF